MGCFSGTVSGVIGAVVCDLNFFLLFSRMCTVNYGMHPTEK